jgi:hypothetical protein
MSENKTTYRVMMLQENSFFSSPSIFFGTPPQANEEDEGDEKEWSFSEGLRISRNANQPAQQQSKSGLFLYWIEISES